MELLLVKKLIEDGLLDFDKLLRKTYRYIGLKEMEAFFLMALHALKLKGIDHANPSMITESLSIDENQVTELLDDLMQRKYLSFEIIENKEGLTSESFSLDQTLSKIIGYYKQHIDEEIVHVDQPSDTDENEIAEILETHLQRQLKPLEVEIIIKWIHEYTYQKHDIKDAIIESVKAGKTSISYIDGILLKKSKHKEDKVIKTNRKKSQALKEFLES